MNLDALRNADPAKHLSGEALDARGEQLLREILGTTPEDAGRTTPAARRPIRDWRPVVATAVVAAAVVAGTVVVIRSTSDQHAAPATSATARAVDLEDAVFAKLGTVAAGDLPVRQKSALTWTDRARGASGGGIDTTGKHLFIAAACDGGGSIAIEMTGRPDAVLDCTSPGTLGPIDLTAGRDEHHSTASLDVVTRSGHPRFVAKSMAFPTAP